MGLDPIGPVQASGSDSQAKDFNNFAQYIYYGTSSENPFNPQNNSYTQVVSDPSNVLANSDANVRIYFVNSNTQMNSSLGFSPTGKMDSNAGLIFSNASSDSTYYYRGLPQGSFVDLGTLSQGTPFDLFLAVDAADGPNKGIFWTNNSLNPYGSVQAKMAHILGTNYYLIGWEDQTSWQSDRDYNDVYVVAEIVAIPEPSTYLLFIAFTAIAFFLKKSRVKRFS